MNEYIKNLDRIEFVVTMACTGSCRHCSEGDHAGFSGHIDPAAAVDSIRKVCEKYRIRSLMTFGGEALLYPEVVCAIHAAAAELGIEIRQLITNGFFSRDPVRIGEVANALKDSGVNDLLLSVDAFHQETIPLEPVRLFAERALGAGIPVRLSPAWLVSERDENPYNLRTRELLRELADLKLPVSSGNVVYPRGSALRYLGEYFDENADDSSPYDEDPRDVHTLSFSPDGSVLNGNVHERDILDILEDYRP